MRDKKKITQEILNQLPQLSDYTVDKIYPLLWYNLRASGGLRLTDTGRDIFTNSLKQKSYAFPIDPMEFDSKILIMLDKKIKMPYYINVKKKMPTEIIMFSESEAILVRLYGNLKTFIERYE